jgi:cell division transport system ATP-binding protein
MIQFAHVTKTVNHKFSILEDINLFIHRGEFVFLTGPSGAGKTTLMRHIYMEDFPSSGQVFVCGFNSFDVQKNNSHLPFLRRKLGVVFQDFKLLFDRTVYENVALALRITGQNESGIKKKVIQVLAKVGLSHKIYEEPEHLSWGEQQRITIARAIANDPYVLLADEPTGNLDAKTGGEIISLLRQINRSGTAVIVATHDIHLIERMPYKVIRIENGKMTNRQY